MPIDEQIYSTKRDAIQDEIFVEAKSLLDEKYVELNQILIRSIVLPPTIKSAIEGKLKQEQESLEYEFKLEKAQKELDEKRLLNTRKKILRSHLPTWDRW